MMMIIINVTNDGAQDYVKGKTKNQNPYDKSIYPDWHNQWNTGWDVGEHRDRENNKT